MVGLCQTTSCRGVLLLLRRFRGSLNGQPVNACRAAAFSLQHREWDEIGAPDPTSNIRPLRFKSLPQDVMGLELQRLQKRVWELNHNFWKRHNTEFQEQKEKFVADTLSQQRLQGGNTYVTKLTANELSLFYKQFLDDKFLEHMHYNKQWMKLQTLLTWTALKGQVSRHSCFCRCITPKP